jgi:RND family efflux transporter MFP subunit
MRNTMNDSFDQLEAERVVSDPPVRPAGKSRVSLAAGVVVIVATAATAFHLHQSAPAQAVVSPAPSVSVSAPLQRNIEDRLGFLGQFSAVSRVEIRAQVGGTLTAIHFKDGDTVHKGDLLFEIDPEPYQIKLSEATAQLESANAKLALATRELSRAQQLQQADAGTVENVDQRVADQHAAQAAVDDAQAQVRDAKFDLDHCRIVAPFTGRIGTHLVSPGNLVAGSRAATSPTTLLATLVSMDPVYVDFDMSEGDYMAFQRARATAGGELANNVDISLSDEKSFTHRGTLDFVDNELNRASGTIHARAIVPNSDLLLTPGGFARVRLSVSTPRPVLLVPDAAVLADQSDHIVLVDGPNDVATPRQVQLGDLRGGLRVIRAGLAPTDKVIIDGIPSVRPGSKIAPHAGTIQTIPDQG